MYAAIDVLADKLDRSVVKHKEKRATTTPARARPRAPRRPAPLAAAMRLIIVSGLSGAGKSVALHMLEDLDYYCVDNIPAALLPFFSHTLRSRETSTAAPASASTRATRPPRSRRCRTWCAN